MILTIWLHSIKCPFLNLWHCQLCHIFKCLYMPQLFSVPLVLRSTYSATARTATVLSQVFFQWEFYLIYSLLKIHKGIPLTLVNFWGSTCCHSLSNPRVRVSPKYTQMQAQDISMRRVCLFPQNKLASHLKEIKTKNLNAIWYNYFFFYFSRSLFSILVCL